MASPQSTAAHVVRGVAVRGVGPLGDAAKFANRAAGFVVGKLGTATATPEDIRRYAAEAGA